MVRSKNAEVRTTLQRIVGVPALLEDLPLATVASRCERPQESQQSENEHRVHKVRLAEAGHEVHQERYQDERRGVQGQGAPFRRANPDLRQYASRQQGCGSHRRPVEDSLVQRWWVKPANWSTALSHDV